MIDKELYKKLLKPPVARAAYSDRTAWLMAELARIAYIEFDSEEFISEIEKLELTLIKTFDKGDTQAYIVKRESEKLAILSFRGTELTCKDILADMKFKFRDVNGVKIHTGFYDAYMEIASSIKDEISKLSEYKLYITGHSLGGALALVATKSLNNDSVAACYTYGNPRVGKSEFGDSIKTPIYRIVNNSDIVPRLPFFFINGYSHHGDMRQLTICNKEYTNLRLLSNPGVFKRLSRQLRTLTSDWKAFISNHSKQEYCDKLKHYAISRLDK